MRTGFRRLDGLVLRACALVAAVVLPLALALDPPDGDLTRLGGYPENRFGPSAPQAIFVPALAEAAKPGTAYDVVVIGDGFSRPDPGDHRTPYGHYWTDHLRNMTGLTVGVLHLDETPVARYLTSADFRERPPRVLIFETAERDLPARTTDRPLVESLLRPAVATPAAAPLAVRPLGVRPQPWTRTRARAWTAPPVGHALELLVKAVPRTLLNLRDTPVQERTLVYAGLFSSAAATTSLFRADDFLPWRADRKLLEDRLRTLRKLQATVEANGTTRFLLMVAPDKGTVYADFLLNAPTVRSAVEEVLAGDPALHVAPLASGLKALAAGGVADLYKPNDSRWGAEGHLYAARAVTATLARMGVLSPSTESPSVATLPCKGAYHDCVPFQVQTD
ncbi:alginate O-acetyltransferase AlgX-related protein [Azospirillum sp. sgz302134]